MTRRVLLLAPLALLLALVAPAAFAQPIVFSTPGDQSYTVPSNGALTLATRGAEGNLGNGGEGATVAATFDVLAGDALTLVVGGAGSGANGRGGGGGGSAVILNRSGTRTLLIVAGAGGGNGDTPARGGRSADGTPGGGSTGGGGGFGFDGGDSFLGTEGGKAGTLDGGGDGGISPNGNGGFGFGGGGGAANNGGGGGGGYSGGSGGLGPAYGRGGTSFVEAAGTNGFVGTDIVRIDGGEAGGSTGQDGSITLSGSATVLTPPAFAKAFTPEAIQTGGTSTLTFTIDNTASGVAATGLAFTDAFPTGLAVATPANLSTTCGGTPAASGASVSLSGGTVGAGATCTVSVEVTSAMVGVYDNVSGDLSSSSGASGTASATLTVAPASPAIRFVDASISASGDGSAWPLAFKTLREVLAVAGTGDEIRVAEGTYTPSATGDRAASFEVPGGVQVLGGYASGGATRDRQPNNGVTDTILSGDLLGDDGPDFANNSENSLHVVRMSGPAAPMPSDPNYTLLEGLTITGGNANASYPDGNGGGLVCEYQCSPALVWVSFLGNTATEFGGGASFAGSSAVFTNVVFSGNSAQNGGGGIFVNESEPVFTNVVFSGNSASSNGGGVYARSDVLHSLYTFTNVVFTGNSANSAGGLYARGIVADFVVQNSILWGNTATFGSQLGLSDGAHVSLDHVLLEGGCSANSNLTCTDVLDGDPLFTDASGGDLTLQPGSPAIDFGDAAFLPADTYDLDGDANTAEPLSLDLARGPRVLNGAVDLGAFESAAVPLVATLTGVRDYRVLAFPTGGTYDDLLAPLWTQGFTGSDDASGGCSAYSYDETAASFEGGYMCLTDQDATFARGQGAYVFVYADDDLSASGVQGGFPKTLSVTDPGFADSGAPFSAFPLTYTNNPGVPSYQEGWNLLGNPLTSGMDWDETVRGGGLTPTIYVLDPNYFGGDYRTWTANIGGDLPNGVVPAFQGFFAKAVAASPTLEAPLASVVSPGPGVYGKDADEPAPLRFELSLDGAPVSAAFVAVAPEAALGLDAQDAIRLTPAAYPRTILSTHTLGDADVVPLALNAVSPEAEGVVELPLEVAAEGHGAGPLALSLAWSGALPEGWTAELVDRQRQTTTSITAGGTYAFDISVPSDAAKSRPSGLGLAMDLPGLAPEASKTTGTAVSTGDRFVLRLTPKAATSTTPEASGETLALLAPTPNPARGAVTLGYTVPLASEVSLVVYDALGREVVVAARGEHAVGTHEARLDLGPLAPGVYVARLTSGFEASTQRFTVVR